MDLDRKALELKQARIPYCVATVVRAEGSAPRHTGAKMLVTASESFGTVGGGGVEHRAIDEAREALRRRIPHLQRYELTESGVQPCGGMVEIFFEPVSVPLPMALFGAGHCAEQLMPMLASLGFDVTVVDERGERLGLPAFSGAARRIAKLPQAALSEIDFSEELHLIVMTHAHVHDEQIVRSCLQKPFRYLGLISSRAKWALFRSRFREQGFSDEQLRRVTSPIGLDLGAETPFEIAVAIAAQLIQLRARPEAFAAGEGHFR